MYGERDEKSSLFSCVKIAPCKEILELDAHDTTWAVVERLSQLYTVRDHIKAPRVEETTGELIGGEFCQACSNIPMQGLMAILAEHMESISILYPREYSVIMQRIKDL